MAVLSHPPIWANQITISTSVLSCHLANDSLCYKGIVYREGDNQSFSFDNNVVGNWANEQAEHTVLGSIKLQYHRTKGGSKTITVLPLLTRGHQVKAITLLLISPITLSVLLIKLKLALMGLRYDWVSTENTSTVVEQDKSRDDNQL